MHRILSRFPILPVTFLLLAAAAGAAGFPELVQRAPAPPAESAGAFSAVARWGDRLFVHYDAACFWSSDGGAVWARQRFVRSGPKGDAPALERGRFTLTAGGIWLGNREGALAWRFDPDSAGWRAWPSGSGAIAAAASVDRLYALSADHVLRLTRDDGATWTRIPLPDNVRIGTFFDDLLADGDHLLLRARDPSNPQPAAYSLDGGASWDWLPAHAAVALARGCAFAIAQSKADVRCADGRSARGLPFATAQASFSDAAGTVYAWADSALYAFEPDGTSLLAGKGEMDGWGWGGDQLYCLKDGTLAWFIGKTPGVALRRPAPRTGIGDHVKWSFPPGGSLDLNGRRVRPAPYSPRIRIFGP